MKNGEIFYFYAEFEEIYKKYLSNLKLDELNLEML